MNTVLNAMDTVLAQKSEKTGILSRYYDFCDKEEKQRTLWFIIPLMSLASAIMPVTIFLMSYFDFFLFFVAISILLFFTNIILSIAGQPTRVTITFYLFTVLFHFLAPLLCFVGMVVMEG